jgi:hypothetical protein
MIQRKSRTTQVSGPAVALTSPGNDPEPGPAYCPTCGRPYFGPASSQLLDLVILTHEQLGKIKAALEAVVIP